MPRIRTIKPEFWVDEKLAPLDSSTRLVFLGLISMADDAGRLVDNQKQIDAFIYPMTSQSAAKPVDTLAAIGRLRRGVTESGQRVIQIVGFTKHQKIDRPNYRACLPPIAGDVEEAPQAVPPAPRKRLARALADRVWTLAQGMCARCGVTCKRGKANRYDNDPTLGEIDHIVAVRDGGGDTPQNLQLLCLSCNRTKAGNALSARNRRAFDDKSSRARRTISVSVPVSVSVPTTNDQNQDVALRADFEAAWAAYPKRPANPKGKAWKAYLARVRAGEDPAAILAGVRAYAAYVEREKIPGKYIKHAATFFGEAKPYLDDYGPVASPTIQLYDPVTGDMTPEAAKILGRIA
ncbi:MAG: HNH endonuclease signature motif containing protein [Candidatus Sericytochromatia bacterium]|nr:HNH endonuclease signature motif containing protein [Candidatus Sericytochromatia bacterium]